MHYYYIFFVKSISRKIFVKMISRKNNTIVGTCQHHYKYTPFPCSIFMANFQIGTEMYTNYTILALYYYYYSHQKNAPSKLFSRNPSPSIRFSHLKFKKKLRKVFPEKSIMTVSQKIQKNSDQKTREFILNQFHGIFSLDIFYMYCKIRL